MKKGVLIVISIIFLIASIVFCLISQFPPEESKSFEVTPSIFKVIVNKGETIETDLEIKNLNEKENFEIEIGDLDKIVYLEKSNFIIPKDNSEKIKIEISGLNEDYGTYMGHISVSNGLEKKVIPFVVSIHSIAQFFAINLDVSPEYRQLKKGEDLVTDIKIFNLYNSQSQTLEINYQIIDINGRKIWSESEEVTIGLKASFTKKFLLPKDITSGDYIFVTSLNHHNTTTTSNYLFTILNKKQISLININILAWIVIAFASITFILVIYLMIERSQFSPNLKKVPVEKMKISEKPTDKKQEKIRKKLKKKLEKEERRKRKLQEKLKKREEKIIAHRHYKELKKKEAMLRKKEYEKKFAQKKVQDKLMKKEAIKKKQKEIPKEIIKEEPKQKIQAELPKEKIKPKTQHIKPHSLNISPSLKRTLSRMKNQHKKRLLSEKISKLKKQNN